MPTVALELDRQIEAAENRLQRLRLLIERQRQLSHSTDATEALAGEVEGFLVSLRDRRQSITDGS